jgi:hypothetical protein
MASGEADDGHGCLAIPRHLLDEELQGVLDEIEALLATREHLIHGVRLVDDQY